MVAIESEHLTFHRVGEGLKAGFLLTDSQLEVLRGNPATKEIVEAVMRSPELFPCGL